MVPSRLGPTVGTVAEGAVAAGLLLTLLAVAGSSAVLTLLTVFTILHGAVAIADRGGVDRWYVGVLIAASTAVAGVYGLLTGVVADELGGAALLVAAAMAVLLALDRRAETDVETPDDRFTWLFEFQIGLAVLGALRERPCSMSDLAADLDLTRSRIETALDRLRRMGFVAERDCGTYEFAGPFGR